MQINKQLSPVANQILYLLEKYGEMTTAEITDKGFGRSTVSSCLSRLEKIGILISRVEKRSRPAYMGEPRMRNVKIFSIPNPREEENV